MVVPVILAKVVAAVAAKKHVAGQEVQVVAVFVFGKDLHAVIPVAGEKLPAYAGRQALVQEFVGDGPADAVAVPVLAGHGIAVVTE